MNLNKTMLAGALTALGKLISRTSGEVLHRSLFLNNHSGTLSLYTCSQEERFEFTCPSEEVGDFHRAVAFEDFRNAVRGGHNKDADVELKSNGVMFVNGTVVPEIKCDVPALTPVPASALYVDLPENFVTLLCHAATTASRSDPRRVLCGIHLDQTGITTTNGKELLHIPREWNMTPVNLPLPLALINTKVKEAGKMWLWKKEDTTRFHISVGPWSWRGKSTSGTFPDWQQIITSKPLPYYVSFSAENALQLQTFLKSLPEVPPNNPVRLTSQSNKLAVENGKGLQSLISAEFSCDWKDFSVTLNKEYLLRALLLGHQQLGFRAAREPFMAVGGVGQYTAMPLLFTSSQPVKEEKRVEHTVSTAVAAPVPPVEHASKNENTVTNPMDELVTAIDEFRAKLKVLSDEAAVLSRKAKEVSLAQKQKERDFIQAKRAIERIRMAI